MTDSLSPPSKLPKRPPKSKAEKELVQICWIASLLVPILFALIIPYHYFWAFAQNEPAHFARAGAAMIAVDILAYGSVRWRADVLMGMAYIGGRRLWNIEVVFGFITALTGVLGTLIWGYGDEVFSWLVLR